MRLLGRYQGRNGEIEIVECSWDGTRIYFEDGVRQSQATSDGESVFTYVKLMDELLHRSNKILVLGCGGGNLGGGSAVRRVVQGLGRGGAGGS